MVQLSKARVDSEKVQNGVWITHPVGFKFRVTRAGGSTWDRFIANWIREQNLEEEPSTELLREALKRTMWNVAVLGWDEVDEDLEDASDEPRPIPFDPDTAYDIFEDESLVYVSDWLYTEINTLANFRLAATLSLEKNLSRSSSSGKTGNSSRKTRGPSSGRGKKGRGQKDRGQDVK